MKRLIDLAGKEEKHVVGLLSGTSADGVDAAVVRIRGHSLDTEIELLAHITHAFPGRVRETILDLGEAPVSALCHMNFVLGQHFADAAEAVVAEAGVAIDLVGSHGQTICHIPRRLGEVGSTLQIGEGDVIAERLGVPVVSDFRTRDMAAGGEGAPLTAYVDYLLYRREGPPRALLNLGGIANVTLVTNAIEEVFAFDTGPANMPLDEVVRIISDGEEHFDHDGRMAADGRVDEALLQSLLGHSYLKLPIPKTTGRETFGRNFVLPLLRGKGTNRAVDVLATLTAFSAHSVFRAFQDFILPRSSPSEVLVSGGGVHNLTLLKHLRRLFGKVAVTVVEEPDAKEACVFATLANETVHGIPNNLPGATGAHWPAVLGKISP